MKITYQNTKLEVLKCPFHWGSTCWDYPSPPELAEELAILSVPSNAKIDFSFSRRPARVEVNIWNNQAGRYYSTKNGIVAPKDNGTYVFSVIGYWRNGQVLYVFQLNVK